MCSTQTRFSTTMSLSSVGTALVTANQMTRLRRTKRRADSLRRKCCISMPGTAQNVWPWQCLLQRPGKLVLLYSRLLTFRACFSAALPSACDMTSLPYVHWKKEKKKLHPIAGAIEELRPLGTAPRQNPCTCHDGDDVRDWQLCPPAHPLPPRSDSSVCCAARTLDKDKFKVDKGGVFRFKADKKAGSMNILTFKISKWP